MSWRYYAQRAVSGLWLDTNCQLSEVGLDWVLSAPNTGSALVPAGIANTALAEDGSKIWGKWDTIMYAEEDNDLSWVGICTAANPDDMGLHLEFIGTSGWLQGVEFSSKISVWQTNVFDIVRQLITHAKTKRHPVDIIPSTNDSAFSIGDPQPPNAPKQPARHKGETKSEYTNSDRYKQWVKDMDEWNTKYGDREKFEVLWWESPMVGEEIDSLAKEVGFEYRERYAWQNRAELDARFYLDLDDDMVRRREDIEFVDGINLALPLDPRDGNELFANNVIGLGAGEGQDMVRTKVAIEDGRLYQAAYIPYKNVRNTTRLRAFAQADLKILNSKSPKIGSVAVWDVQGYADVKTLRVGDEVKVRSQNTVPNIDSWNRITTISREPATDVAILELVTI